MDEVLPITHIINQKLKRDQRKKKKNYNPYMGRLMVRMRGRYGPWATKQPADRSKNGKK